MTRAGVLSLHAAGRVGCDDAVGRAFCVIDVDAVLVYSDTCRRRGLSGGLASGSCSVGAMIVIGCGEAMLGSTLARISLELLFRRRVVQLIRIFFSDLA